MVWLNRVDHTIGLSFWMVYIASFINQLTYLTRTYS